MEPHLGSIKDLIELYRQRIALAERLVQPLEQWRRELVQLEDAWLVAQSYLESPLSLPDVVSGLKETGFAVERLASVLVEPEPIATIPEVESKPMEPALVPMPPVDMSQYSPLLRACIEVMLQAGQPLHINAIVAAVKQRGTPSTYGSVRIALGSASRSGGPIVRKSRGTYGLREGFAPQVIKTFGSEQKPLTIRELAERELLKRGKPMTSHDLHRAILATGRECTYTVLVATLNKSAQAPGALLIHYRGHPPKYGLLRWRRHDHTVYPSGRPTRLPEPPALLAGYAPAIAAWEVLAQRGTALHWEDIAGQVPASSRKAVRGILYRGKFRPVFCLVGPGTFGLVDWPLLEQELV